MSFNKQINSFIIHEVSLWSTKVRMVEITKGVHSIDDLRYPVPGVGFVHTLLKKRKMI
jgi:hypothetical protein